MPIERRAVPGAGLDVLQGELAGYAVAIGNEDRQDGVVADWPRLELDLRQVRPIAGFDGLPACHDAR